MIPHVWDIPLICCKQRCHVTIAPWQNIFLSGGGSLFSTRFLFQFLHFCTGFFGSSLVTVFSAGDPWRRWLNAAPFATFFGCLLSVFNVLILPDSLSNGRPVITTPPASCFVSGSQFCVQISATLRYPSDFQRRTRSTACFLCRHGPTRGVFVLCAGCYTWIPYDTRDILRVARDCLDRGNVEFVCICQLMYRAAALWLSSGSRSAARHPLRVGYNGLIDDVNRELRRLIFFFPRIHFWKHRGMLLDGCSLLGADGRHLEPRGACGTTKCENYAKCENCQMWKTQ